MLVNRALIAVLTVLAIFLTAASPAIANANQVFVQAKNQYLLYVYPKTPYVQAGRTMVSFPYFFEALGGIRTQSGGTVSVNFARGTLAYDAQRGSFAINGTPAKFALERDASTGTVFVPVSVVLNTLGLPYAFNGARRTLRLWGADYFQNVLNSGAGTPFDNVTPTDRDAHPLQFELSRGAIGPVPVRASDPNLRQGAARERYRISLNLPLRPAASVRVMRLYTHLGDATGFTQQTAVGGTTGRDGDDGSTACTQKQRVLRCEASVEMYRNRPGDSAKNPLFYMLLKVVE